jgi:hypothetical protein
MQRFWMFMIAGLIEPQPMRIVVNLPAFRLDAYVNDTLVRTMPIAPGMARYPTPRGTFTVTSIEWNPWWIPPDSPWAAKEKPTGPGPTNPMGRVKLNFRPLYFLHGTPFEQSIGTASSHGCVRLKNGDAIALARLVLRFGTPARGEAEIDGLANDTATTRKIELDEPVPVELRYDLVELRDGIVSVYRNVYGLSVPPLRDEVYAVLAAHGVDTLQIDSAGVRSLVRRVPAAGRSIPIESLFIVAPSSSDASSVVKTELPAQLGGNRRHRVDAIRRVRDRVAGHDLGCPG